MNEQPTQEKAFDCVKWTREVRDRINEKIADMSYAELSQWLEEGVRKNPFFSRIPVARKPPSRALRREHRRTAALGDIGSPKEIENEE